MESLAKDIAIALTSNPEFKSSIINQVVSQFTNPPTKPNENMVALKQQVKVVASPPPVREPTTKDEKEESLESMIHMPTVGFEEFDPSSQVSSLPKRKREEETLPEKRKREEVIGEKNNDYDCVTIFASNISNCIGRGGPGDREWELAGVWKKMDPISYLYCHEKSTHVRHFSGNTYSSFRAYLLNNRDIPNKAMLTQLSECSSAMNEPEPWKHIDLDKVDPRSVGISKEKKIIEKMAKDQGFSVSYDNIKGIWNAGTQSDQGYSVMLDEGKWRIMTKTDAMVTDEKTGKQIVVDAKNRRRKINVDSDDISNSDFYQIQAYMHIRNVDEGMIVEADDYGNSRQVLRKRSDHVWKEIVKGLDTFTDDVHRLLSKDPAHNRFKLWVLYREQHVVDKINGRRK